MQAIVLSSSSKEEQLSRLASVCSSNAFRRGKRSLVQPLLKVRDSASGTTCDRGGSREMLSLESDDDTPTTKAPPPFPGPPPPWMTHDDNDSSSDPVVPPPPPPVQMESQKTSTKEMETTTSLTPTTTTTPTPPPPPPPPPPTKAAQETRIPKSENGAAEDQIWDDIPSPPEVPRSPEGPTGPAAVPAPSGDVCAPRVTRGLYWNWTRSGEVFLQPCPGGSSGFAQWRCIGKDWVPFGPDLSTCKSLWLNSLETRLVSGESVVSIASDLSQVTSTKALYGGDVWATARLLENLAESIWAGSDDIQVTEVLKSILKVTSQLLGDLQRTSWQDLASPLRRQTATKLLTALEENAFLLANTFSDERKMIMAETNILMSVESVRFRHDMLFPNEYDLQFWQQFPGASLYLPLDRLTHEDVLGQLVFFYFDTLHEILDINDDAISAQSSGSSRPSAELSPTFINSKIISASLGPSRHIELSSPVRILFHHLVEANISHCVVWDFVLSWWSVEGCHVVFTNASMTECECNHLTHFAVTSQRGPPVKTTPSVSNPADEHKDVLPTAPTDQHILIYVGVVFACLGILAGLVFFYRHRNVIDSHQSFTLRNLFLCIFVAEIIFLVIVLQSPSEKDQTSSPSVLCSILAGCLHFFLLSIVLWMLVLSFQVYHSVKSLTFNCGSRLKMHVLICYGIPALIVAVSCSVQPSSFGSAQQCWLHPFSFLMFSFVAPALVGIVAAVGLIGVTLYAILTEEDEKMAAPRSSLHLSILLLALLLTVWTLALTYFYETTHVIGTLLFLAQIGLAIVAGITPCLCRGQLKRLTIFSCLTAEAEKPPMVPTTLYASHRGTLHVIPNGLDGRPVIALQDNNVNPGAFGTTPHNGFMCHTLRTGGGGPHHCMHAQQAVAPRITVNRLENVLNVGGNGSAQSSPFHQSNGTTTTNYDVMVDGEYSIKSLSHDSGHGSSEMEDSPRMMAVRCSGQPRTLAHHHYPVSLHYHSRRAGAVSPWGHMYTEIPHSNRSAPQSQEPVYVEIEGEHLAAGGHPFSFNPAHSMGQPTDLQIPSDLSDEEMQRRGGDHRPLLRPTPPASASAPIPSHHRLYEEKLNEKNRLHSHLPSNVAASPRQHHRSGTNCNPSDSDSGMVVVSQI
ncbi:unnamed protein product [Cyprideis torosa]|uniref:Latrophilin Cirl n=1 Tax=Cyprideis torosa TaxID=163714 RepID=A0A7R8WKN3_9CRUS|nr:unnamed protein product [Cyprideis torosa]CAG0896298.1 unnamed protein product [Cyprideis torosa]